MRLTPPDYFEPIRQGAERRWQQLEADPELAGPWHQLFKQVQSPRHVLSELLQNADDAGATEASARVDNGVFEFTHNGEDFQPDHFASLCRFGYSNKRSLHTIGFRGIGFKSTFSLGPVVGIRTPSLSVYFEKDRFTLPCWYDQDGSESSSTRIIVKIQDDLRQAELAKNLREWKQSPVSLLFFRNIRSLTLDSRQLFWQSNGTGPIQNSEWYVLRDSAAANLFLDESDKEEAPVLLVRSEAEEFPEDCIAEIRQERILGADSDFSLPASRVELVLGASAGIYVVLPTAVKPDLPFACNGPFMQDPARVKIKDPETSPTNRWLLSRVGKLAASCMCNWLANQSLEITSRAEAYRLLPKAGIKDKSKASIVVSGRGGVESECVDEVSNSFFAYIQYQQIVLAHDGAVEASGACIALDKQIQDIWDAATFSQEIDPKGRKQICHKITANTADLLHRMGQIDKVNRSQFCRFLQETNPPHPGEAKLLLLWIYIAGEFTKDIHIIDDIAIVPIADQDHLFPPRSAVRLGTSKAQLNELDVKWLSEHILFVDRGWLVFLVEQDTDYVLQQGKYSSITAKEVALSLLQRMGFADGTDTTKLIERIAASLRASNALDSSACVRLAHICARLDCRVSMNFPYITQSGEVRYIAKGVCYDSTKTIQPLLPYEYLQRLFLSDLYATSSTSCNIDEWDSWLASNKPALRSFPPLLEIKHEFRHAKELLEHIAGVYGEKLDTDLFPHKWERFSTTQLYTIVDYDIDNQITAYWSAQQTVEQSLSTLAGVFLQSSSMEWFSQPLVEIYQTNTNGLRESLVEGHEIPASWLRRFRDTPCIPDTRGNLCKPRELLRRSEETEPLIGVERFVEKRFDHSANDSILTGLGISSALPGPNVLLSVLSALAAIESPPREEVARLYDQLDKLYLLSKPEDQNQVLDAFRSGKLLLTEQGLWSTPISVFISADGLEGAGILTVIGSARHLSLWRQLGLRERPDAEAAIEMIRSMPLHSDLGSETYELLKTLMRRFTVDVIDHCGIWISLSKQLRPIGELPYGLTKDGINPDLLFVDIQEKCADLRFIDGYSLESLLQKVPVRDLDAAISYQLEDNNIRVSQEVSRPQWLQTFGMCVSRLSAVSSDNTGSLAGLGETLKNVTICYRDNLMLTPVVDSKPIGRAVVKDGALISETLYVQQLPVSRLASLIPIIIGDFLQSPQLQAAAAYCFERSDYLIVEYFKANYVLDEQAAKDSFGNLATQVVEKLIPEAQILTPTADTDLGDLIGSELYSEERSLNDQPQDPAETQKLSAPKLSEVQDFLLEDDIEKHPDDPFSAPSSMERDGLARSASSQHSGSTSSRGVSNPPLPDEISDKASPSESPEETGNSAQYSIVVQYAESLGLKEVGDGLFRSSNYTSLRRQRGDLFPWILEAPTGLELKRFLVRTSPIVASPLELDTVAFGLLERLPDGHSILIPDTSGNATEISGIQLQAMITDGRIKVFPSSYRLALV